MKLAKIALAALLACTARAALAQTLADEREEPRSRPEWSLRRTMREFVKVWDPTGYFPTRGEWSWTLTTHYRANPDATGFWRFPAAAADS
ncbi:MAG TPA: hypothetical protein VF705_03365, partial [Longimicrobium sp.]